MSDIVEYLKNQATIALNNGDKTSCAALSLASQLVSATQENESLRQQLADTQRKLEAASKDAATAWTVCASIHREYAKGKDPLFITRQQDFTNSEIKARSFAIEQSKGGDDGN